MAREADPDDARAKRLLVTPLGFEVLRQGEAIFDGLRRQWEQQIGRDQLDALEQNLHILVGDSPIRFDTPGWLAREAG